MKTRFAVTLVALCTVLSTAILMSTDALAHHGWGGPDASKTLTLTGSIAESNTPIHMARSAQGRR